MLVAILALLIVPRQCSTIKYIYYFVGFFFTDEELKALAQEVVDLLKKKVGVETFTKAFVSSQRARVTKREIRKRQFAEEVCGIYYFLSEIHQYY